MIIVNKKFVYQFIMRILSVFGGKKAIAFYAPVHFHSEHLLPVINKLAEENRVEIILIGNFEMQPSIDVRYFESVSQLPFATRIDIFIATEFGSTPWWTNCPTVYFGHGIGPKLNYASKQHLLEYDYSFVGCQPYFDAQQKYEPNIKIEKIGLPITDKPTDRKTEIQEFFNLDDNKPLIIFAPSWHAEVYYISPLFDIFEFLAQIKFANVIISPHPLLLEPARCNDIDYFRDIPAPLKLNLPESDFSTLDLCASGDLVISDISSIFFEAMAMGITAVFDGNDDLYISGGAEYLLPEIKKACHSMNWEKQDLSTLAGLLKSNRRADSQEAFINNYIFNKGSATKSFIHKINEIIDF
jgi:hypothetical protein